MVIKFYLIKGTDKVEKIEKTLRHVVMHLSPYTATLKFYFSIMKLINIIVIF